MNDIEMIPLGKLRLSEANVRKSDSDLFIGKRPNEAMIGARVPRAHLTSAMLNRAALLDRPASRQRLRRE